MIFRHFLLVTSLAAAVGNYGFLIGLDDKISYMYSLSISSLVGGAFSYAFLPNLVTRLSRTGLMLSLAGSAFVGAGFAIASVSGAAAQIFMTVFLFLCAEIILARYEQWTKIYGLRLIMMVTGGLSWIVPDHSAILGRVAIVGLSVGIALFLWGQNPIRKTITALPSTRLLCLVLVNLLWVYVLPLIVVIDSASTEKVLLYIFTTLIPLIYFKAQDVVFKADVLGATSKHSTQGHMMFLLGFASPLALFYLAFPPLYYFDLLQGNQVKIWVFTGLSLTLLALNIYLTQSLVSPAPSAKVKVI